MKQMMQITKNDDGSFQMDMDVMGKDGMGNSKSASAKDMDEVMEKMKEMMGGETKDSDSKAREDKMTELRDE